ncbi:MAG: penicillin-binding protein 2 [Caldilineae bacterium]|nr:MAG: penicillin-binding protein 2 [Caldilineae bacterium]
MNLEQGGNIYRLRPDSPATNAYIAQPRQSPKDADPHEIRIYIMLALFLLFGLILAGQLIRYQAFGVVPKTARENPNAAIDQLLERGVITDRRGHPLAMDHFKYEIKISPKDIEDPEAFAERVAPIIGKDPLQLVKAIEENRDAAYLTIAYPEPPAIGEKVIALGEPTIGAVPWPKRYYPEGNLACHVLGLVAGDRRGYYGLEGYFDDFLRASTRAHRLFGPLIPADDVEAPPLPDTPFLPSYVHQDIVLTLDRTIQYLAETRLKEALEKYEAESGTIIVMEPQTSAVLAMASLPCFNPNDYTLVDDESVYANPAISKFYEPGSVFKVITFAAALNEGVITPDKVYDDTDKFVYGERTIQNWDRKGRGKVTATEALAYSLNVTTAKIAVELGAQQFYRYVRRFGFGDITGIELENEVPGLVKTPGREGWYPADLATNAFGQGISVTPLQMANAVAAIAAGGVRHRAYIVQHMIDGNKIRTTEPKPEAIVISPETARTLTDMMVTAVQYTPKARIKGYRVAGKTGTAEIPRPEGYSEELTKATFVGFFPADDPRFLILVKLDRPKTSRWATDTAAPTFRALAQDLIRLYAIPPDSVRRGETSSAEP